jgi:hypothetical protein
MYRKFEFDVTENLFFCIVYFSSELNTVKMQVLGVLISSTVRTVLAGAGHVVKADSNKNGKRGETCGHAAASTRGSV